MPACVNGSYKRRPFSVILILRNNPRSQGDMLTSTPTRGQNESRVCTRYADRFHSQVTNTYALNRVSVIYKVRYTYTLMLHSEMCR